MLKHAIKSLNLSQYRERLALWALMFFVATEVSISCTTLMATYPQLAAIKPLLICESVSMALSLMAITASSRVFSRRRALLIVVSFSLLLVSASEMNDYRLVHGFIVLVAIAGINPKKVARVYYGTVLPIVIAIMMMSLIGVLHNKDYIPNSSLVFTYGFAHPNTLGAILFSAMSAMVYERWNGRLWALPTAFSLICAVFSFVSLSSHASAAALLLLACCSLVGHATPVRHGSHMPSRVFFILLLVVPVILLMAMLSSVYFYNADNLISVHFDNLIHGRSFYAHEYYITHGGFPIFGRPFSYAGSYHNGLAFGSVDSGYCYIALVGGLFALCALLALYIIAIWRLSKIRPLFSIASIILIASAYLLVEGYPLYIMMSFAALLTAEAFSGDRVVTSEISAGVHS